MKRLTMTVLLFSIAALAAFSQENNPFFDDYKTPFGVPPFDKIDTSHYLPAFAKGIAEQQAEIDAIANNAAEPTFENTILPFDRSGKLLTKVSAVFYSLNSANTNDAMQSIARKVSPLVTEHSDNIMLNDKLFKRIKKVYDDRNNGKLDDQQIRVVEKYYDDFVRSGANLSESDKEKLRDYNQKLSALELKFGENLLAETNKNFKLVIDNKEDLAGLSQDIIDAAAELAKQFKMDGKWVFTLQKPSMIPFLQYSSKRELRHKLYEGYFMRGNNNNEFDNKEIILDIMNLRAQKAKLLGYKNYGEYIISNNMAKNMANVYKFLNEIMKPALQAAAKDRDEMQKIIDAERGNFKLESWDWWYYSEKLRKAKYDIDESELKPYFVLSNVRDGMFYAANQLYGITFTQRKDLPVYDPEVEVFEAKDANGSHLGILYLDYYPRLGKRVGAWCGSFRDQTYENGKKIYPIITVVYNFTRANGETPALLTWDEVTTMFHEFGHALHGLFTDGKYYRTAGNLPRDMIELPSQVMENWASTPEVMKIYAKHYKTGEALPKELFDKLQKSLVFNEGFNTVEYIAASILDLDWHSFDTVKNVNVLDFEKQSMDRIGLIKEIIPRYRTTYFNHIIGGYAAGYYVYLWAAVLDADAFQAFEDSGNVFNKDLAAKFRKYVLTEGGSGEGMDQYIKFRGQEPSPEPLLKKRGLK